MNHTITQLSSTVQGLITASNLPSRPSNIWLEKSRSNPMMLFDVPDAWKSSSALSPESDMQDITYVGEPPEPARESHSLVSMIKDAQATLSQRFTIPDWLPPLGANHDMSPDEFVKDKKRTLQQLLEDLTRNDTSMSHDGQGLSLPLQALSRDSLEPYFQRLNPVLPFLNEDIFRERIEQTYGGGNSAQPDPAWTLCISNVILLSLNARAKSGPTAHSAVDAGLADIQSILLKTARRGITKLEELSAPRLINVQALISMVSHAFEVQTRRFQVVAWDTSVWRLKQSQCIVCQEYFQLELANTFLRQACQVAKEMALHRQRADFSGQDSAQTQERRDLFWALYVVDKNLSLISGSACSLLYNDCDVPYPEEDKYTLKHHFKARIQLAQIQEQVHTALYAPSSLRWSDPSRRGEIHQLTQSLQRWSETYEPMINPYCSISPETRVLLDDELAFGFFNTQALVMRQVRTPVAQRQCLDKSTKSIKILAQMFFSRRSDPGTHVPRRPFQCLPFPTYFDVFANLVVYPTNNGAKEELALLREVEEMFRDIANVSNETGYYSRALHVVSNLNSITSDLMQRANSDMRSVSDAATRINGSPYRANNLETMSQPSLGVTSQPYQKVSPAATPRRSDTCLPSTLGHGRTASLKRPHAALTSPPLTPASFTQEPRSVPLGPPLPGSGLDDWLDFEEMSLGILHASPPEFVQPPEGMDLSIDNMDFPV